MRSYLIGLMLLAGAQWSVAATPPSKAAASGAAKGAAPAAKVAQYSCAVAGSGTPACTAIPIQVASDGNGGCTATFDYLAVYLTGRASMTGPVHVVWQIVGAPQYVFDPTDGINIVGPSGGGVPRGTNWGTSGVESGSGNQKFFWQFKKSAVAVPVTSGFSFTATIYDTSHTNLACTQVDPVIGNN